MSDEKISELTALTMATLADDDEFAVVDTSAVETKRIVTTELLPVLQVVSSIDGSVFATSTTIAYDDSIPQNTEGAEFITLAITPKNANSNLIIEAFAYVTAQANAARFFMCLFVDSDADALSTTGAYLDTNFQCMLSLKHVVAAGSTTARTYKIRLGASGGATLNINGAGGSRYFGGTCNSGIVITEVNV